MVEDIQYFEKTVSKEAPEPENIQTAINQWREEMEPGQPGNNPFSTTEWQQILNWSAKKDTVSRESFLKLIGKLSHQPIQQVWALVIFQGNFFSNTDYAECLAVLKEAISISDGEDRDLRDASVFAKSELATIAIARDHDFVLAEKLLEEAIGTMQELAGEGGKTDIRRAISLLNLMHVKMRKGNFPTSWQCYNQVFHDFSETNQISWSALLGATVMLPRQYQKTGNLDQAKSMADWILAGFEHAQKLAEKGVDSKNIAEQEGGFTLLGLKLYEFCNGNQGNFSAYIQSIKKVQATTMAEQGNISTLIELIKKYENEQDGFDKSQSLGELYPASGRYWTKKYQWLILQSETRERVGMTPDSMSGKAEQARKHYKVAFEEAIDQLGKVGLLYHHSEVILEKTLARLTEQKLTKIKIEAEELKSLKQELFTAVRIIEGYVGKSFFRLLDPSNEEKPPVLEIILRVTNLLYDLDSAGKNCKEFLREFEKFITHETLTAIAKSRQKHGICGLDDGEKSESSKVYENWLKVGKDVFRFNNLHVLDAWGTDYNSDQDLEIRLDESFGLQKELVRYANKIMDLRHFTDYRQVLAYIAKRELAIELNSFYLEGKPTKKFPDPIGSIILTYANNKLVIVTREPTHNIPLNIQEKRNLMTDLLGVKSRKPEIKCMILEKGDVGYEESCELGERIFRENITMPTVTQGDILHVKQNELLVEFSGCIERKEETIAVGAMFPLRESCKKEELHEKYCRDQPEAYAKLKSMRKDHIETGGLAIRYAYRGDKEVFLRICKHQAEYMRAKNCKGGIAIASLLVRRLLKSLNPKDPPFVEISDKDITPEHAISVAGLDPKFVKDWDSYYRQRPRVIQIDCEKLIKCAEDGLQKLKAKYEKGL